MTAADSGSSEGEKRARIKRSKNSKQPKPKKLKSSTAQSETDSEARHTEVRTGREELTEHGGSTPSMQDLEKMQPDESMREAEMSSSEGETWIADEDIMVESGMLKFIWLHLISNFQFQTNLFFGQFLI